jgi:mono/diheme cytochrome c family protein
LLLSVTIGIVKHQHNDNRQQGESGHQPERVHKRSVQLEHRAGDDGSDAEAAALANYLRVTWGGRKGDVTPAAVRALR